MGRLGASVGEASALGSSPDLKVLGSSPPSDSSLWGICFSLSACDLGLSQMGK